MADNNINENEEEFVTSSEESGGEQGDAELEAVSVATEFPENVEMQRPVASSYDPRTDSASDAYNIVAGVGFGGTSAAAFYSYMFDQNMLGRMFGSDSQNAVIAADELFNGNTGAWQSFMAAGDNAAIDSALAYKASAIEAGEASITLAKEQLAFVKSVNPEDVSPEDITAPLVQLNAEKEAAADILALGKENNIDTVNIEGDLPAVISAVKEGYKETFDAQYAAQEAILGKLNAIKDLDSKEGLEAVKELAAANGVLVWDDIDEWRASLGDQITEKLQAADLSKADSARLVDITNDSWVPNWLEQFFDQWALKDLAKGNGIDLSDLPSKGDAVAEAISASVAADKAALGKGFSEFNANVDNIASPVIESAAKVSESAAEVAQLEIIVKESGGNPADLMPAIEEIKRSDFPMTEKGTLAYEQKIEAAQEVAAQGYPEALKEAAEKGLEGSIAESKEVIADATQGVNDVVKSEMGSVAGTIGETASNAVSAVFNGAVVGLNALPFVDNLSNEIVASKLAVGGTVALQVLYYGFAALKLFRAGQVISDSHATDESKTKAAGGAMLIAGAFAVPLILGALDISTGGMLSLALVAAKIGALIIGGMMIKAARKAPKIGEQQISPMMQRAMPYVPANIAPGAA